ncbi:16S rRNA (cytosine(1402)-N(4))-methyltransferase RsmH [bacterium]|nr:16S rRNA (cytosine(1402)-N(4))-methyltransferase RsmH [bacterium]
MSDGGSGHDSAVGSVPHRSVLLEESMHWLDVRPEGVYLDATCGAGGHTEAIAKRLTTGRVIALDRDEQALRIAGERLAPYGDKVRLVHAPFSDAERIFEDFKLDRVDGALADLGVSSMQLDNPERGFSFAGNEPLDMRMDPTRGEAAWRVLQTWPEAEIARVLFEYGEERFSRRIAKRIVEQRRGAEPFTGQSLRQLIVEALPGKARHQKIDPATRSFQGLRIAINRELEELETFLDTLVTRCRPGGRIVVISFHSLEDRIVKRRFRDWSKPEYGPSEGPPAPATRPVLVRVLTRKPVTPSDGEIEANPRARSAKLRAAEVLGSAE